MLLLEGLEKSTYRFNMVQILDLISFVMCRRVRFFPTMYIYMCCHVMQRLDKRKKIYSHEPLRSSSQNPVETIKTTEQYIDAVAQNVAGFQRHISGNMKSTNTC